MSTVPDRPVLRPSGIGQYIAFSSCPRYLKLRFDDEGEEDDRAWGEAFKPLSILLSGTGDKFETETRDSYERQASEHIHAQEAWQQSVDLDDDFEGAIDTSREGIRTLLDELDKLDSQDDPLLVSEILLAGYIEEWPVGGRSDLVSFWPNSDGIIEATVCEIKASWREKSSHQLQATIYAMILERLIESLGREAEIETGVLHRESEIDSLSKEELKTFDIAPREDDIHRLLSPQGPIQDIIDTSLNKVNYQLNSKCDNCIYSESCITRAVENQSTALLNLSIGEQEVLAEEEITDIEEVAELLEPPNWGEGWPRPDKFDTFRPNPDKRDTVDKLRENSTIGDKLENLVVRSRAMLEQVNEDHELSYPGNPAPFYNGVGYGTLPSDNPPDFVDAEYEPGEMIRVYLHVQWDYMRDRICMLSARVNCTNFPADGVSFSMVSDDLPHDRNKSLDEEATLLKEFFNGLFNRIKLVADHSRSDNPPMHVYLFSQTERDKLIEAIRRHVELAGTDAVRDLSGLREAIDQSMVSVIQDEARQRLALRYPCDGLLPILDQAKVKYKGGDEWFENDERPWQEQWFGWENWNVDPEDDESFNLKQVFYHNFFNYESGINYKKDGEAKFDLQQGAYQTSDDEYISRARFGGQLPLEYIWAAKENLNEEWLDEDQYEEKRSLEKYKYHDPREDDPRRIGEQELEALGRRLCAGIEHIERSIGYKNAKLGKKPLEDGIPEIDEYSLGSTDMTRASQEYLELEYSSSRQDKLQHYAKPVRQRVLTGKSAVIEVLDTTEDEDGLVIEGRLAYDDLNFPNPSRIANSCRLKGPEGATSGSWLVASKIERDDNGMYTEVGKSKPQHIEKGVGTKVKNLDMPNRHITLRLGRFKKKEEGNEWVRHKYGVRHNSWTNQPSKADTYVDYFEPGDMWVLDEQADSLPASRSAQVLENADQNTLIELLSNVLLSTPGDDLLEAEFSPKDDREDIVDWLKKSNSFDKPNNLQRKFIAEYESRLVALQGPPGTGKSGGALANSILARCYSRIENGKPFWGLVTAPSNKAIEEVLEKFARRVDSFRSETSSQVLDDLRIIRASGRDMLDIESLPGVERLNYNSPTCDLEPIANGFESGKTGAGQRGLGEFTSNYEDMVIFATPTSTYGLINNLAPHLGDKNAKRLLSKGRTFFNFLAVDEASMMQLPDFLSCGAFLTADSQIIVAGDHRQMPPVQQHDWETEDRRTIEVKAPYLSTLDFIRFVNGDKELEHTDNPSGVSIPMLGLERSYRCHERVADFLREWIYERLDGVEYWSAEQSTLSNPGTDNEAVAKIMAGKHPLVLIVYDDDTSQQSNEIERDICQSLIHASPTDDTGIVTPHNAQRGLLRNDLGDLTDVDTVERFQGGEREFITVSATVSDPEYIRLERDFILSPNRLNVAMSRMEEKLIVVAGKSLFEVIPQDAEDYDNAMLWRGLYQTVNAGAGTPLWEGQLWELRGDDDNSGYKADVDVRAFSGGQLN